MAPTGRHSGRFALPELKRYESGKAEVKQPAGSPPAPKPKKERVMSQATLERAAKSPVLPKNGAIVRALDEAALSEAIGIVRQLGQEVTEQTDPRFVMLTLVHNTFLMTRAIEAMIRGLEEKHLSGIGKYVEVRIDGETIRVADHHGQLAEARLRLYGEWVDRSSRVASLAVRAGLETRLVELAEQQARAIATVLQRFLRNLGYNLGLNPEQQEIASNLMWQEVQLLGTAEVPLHNAEQVPQHQEAR